MAKPSSRETKHGSEVDALALVPPPAFVAARNALVKELRAGDPKTAAEVAKRKRPSWTTWALATIASDDAGLVDDVFAAGSALQHAALSGGDVRTAQTSYSSALEKATKAALGALAKAGQHAPAATQIRDLRSALRAAVLEGPASRARLLAGTFSAADDDDASAFGSTEAAPAKAKAKANAKAAPDISARDSAAKKRAAREAEIAREAAAKKHAAHVAKVAKLRAALDEATHVLEEAEHDVRAKTRALHDATKARDAAKTSADAAKAALDDEA